MKMLIKGASLCNGKYTVQKFASLWELKKKTQPLFMPGTGTHASVTVL